MSPEINIHKKPDTTQQHHHQVLVSHAKNLQVIAYSLGKPFHKVKLWLQTSRVFPKPLRSHTENRGGDAKHNLIAYNAGGLKGTRDERTLTL
jgi:hypothetical protein